MRFSGRPPLRLRYGGCSPRRCRPSPACCSSVCRDGRCCWLVCRVKGFSHAIDFPCHLEAGRPIVVRRPKRFHQSPLCFDLLCSHQPFILFHGQDPLRLLHQEVLNRWASIALQDKGRQQHIVQHATSRNRWTNRRLPMPTAKLTYMSCHVFR